MLANSTPALGYLLPTMCELCRSAAAGQGSPHSRVRSAPYLSAMSVVARPTSLPTVAPIISMGTNRPEAMALPAAIAANMKYQASIINRDL